MTYALLMNGFGGDGGLNIILIIVCAIMAIYMIVGAYRGLVKTAFSLLTLAVAVFIAGQAGPYAGKVLQRTVVYEVIEGGIEDRVSDFAWQQAEKAGEQIEVIDRMPLPQVLRRSLVENNNQEIYNALNIDAFAQYLSAYLACLVLNAFGFILAFILALIVLKALESGLDLLSKLPVIHAFNGLGGACVGAVKGIIVVWVLCIVVTMIASTSLGIYILEQINNNQILSLIYNNNILMNNIGKMSRLLF